MVCSKASDVRSTYEFYIAQTSDLQY